MQVTDRACHAPVKKNDPRLDDEVGGLAEVLQGRRAGVLLHPTSLPGDGENGDFGKHAYWFVDWMVRARLGVWQVLPLGPTHDNGSPYQSMSAYAGNPALISLELLVQDGLLSEQAVRDAGCSRAVCLEQAFACLKERRDGIYGEYLAFRNAHKNWLDDHCLFQALRSRYGASSWLQWPEGLRARRPRALQRARRELTAQIDLEAFRQFVFYRQWLALRRYANERGVLLFGDLPIFVDLDSADVWAYQQYFQLKDNGEPAVVAGVPPDYFSATGQRWGNPLYDWERLAEDGYRWWIDRIRCQLTLFDFIRIDHFRGFESYWQIPAEEPTALNGQWMKGPGDALFEAIGAALGRLPLVAEDLGLITEEVTALRRRHHLPGMKVLQFAFDGSAQNPYLPHYHCRNSVVYTGTHDNDTTLGWYQHLDEGTKVYIDDYLGGRVERPPWPFIRTAMASVAELAIVPMQDFLELGSEHRMNQPGVSEGNWRWRFGWEQVPEDLADRIRHWCERYDRR